MNWKSQLAEFEKNKNWDAAITFMESIIEEDKADVYVYIFMLYLLMNILVEERYDTKKHDEYATLLKKYFDESYDKFSNNATYLYYVGRIASMSEWYFDIDIQTAQKMIDLAATMEPNNLVYQWDYYYSLDPQIPGNEEQIAEYVEQVFTENSAIRKELCSKGAVGEYILSMMEHWGNRVKQNLQI